MQLLEVRGGLVFGEVLVTLDDGEVVFTLSLMDCGWGGLLVV
jgi:hypothetical protein